MMSAIVRELIAAGVTGDALVTAIERIEAAMEPPRSKGAVRTERWRAKARERLEASQNVTRDAKEIPPTPPKEKYFSLSSSESSLSLKEGSAEQASGRGEPGPFDQFWKLYPHKVGKGAARREFERIQKSKIVDFTELIAGLLRYAAKTDDRPWCNPATWLHQHRWTDEPADQPEKPNGKSLTAAADRALSVLAGWGDPAASGGLRNGASPPAFRLLSQGGGD